MSILALITANTKFLEEFEQAEMFKTFIPDRYNVLSIAQFIKDNFIEKKTDDFFTITLKPLAAEQLKKTLAKQSKIFEPELLYIEFLEWLHGYEAYRKVRGNEDFENARLSKGFDAIEIPVLIDNQAAASAESMAVTPAVLITSASVLKPDVSAEFFPAHQDLYSAIMDNAQTLRLEFSDAVKLVNAQEYVDRISAYIIQYHNSNDLNAHQNAEVFLLAALSTQSPSLLTNLALLGLACLHVSFRQLKSNDQSNICRYLFFVKDVQVKNIKISIYKFLQPYVVEKTLDDLFYDAYMNEIQWETISAKQFLSLKDKQWPTWPIWPNPQPLTSPFQEVFLRYHFALLSSKDKAEITVNHLNEKNFTKLFSWNFNKPAFFRELAENHCALLNKALNQVVGTEFILTRLEELNSIVTSYHTRRFKWNSAENDTITNIILNLPYIKNYHDLNCMQKINLYYTLFPYMEKYSNFSWMRKPILVSQLHILYNTLKGDLSSGALTLYVGVNPNIENIAKMQFATALHGSATGSTVIANGLPALSAPSNQTSSLNGSASSQQKAKEFN